MPSRDTTWSSGTASNSRARRNGSGRSIPRRSSWSPRASGSPRRATWCRWCSGSRRGPILAGMVAGGMTKSNKIGFVGGIELPPIKRGYEGWVNGAKAVNPRGRQPGGLPQHLRRRRGRARGGAGDDPGRRRHAAPQRRPGRAGTVPGGEGEPGGLRLRRQRRPDRAGAGPGPRFGRHRSAPGVSGHRPRGQGTEASRPRSSPSGWPAGCFGTIPIPRWRAGFLRRSSAWVKAAADSIVAGTLKVGN